MAQPEQRVEVQFPDLTWEFSNPFLVSPMKVRMPADWLAELQAHIDAECNSPARMDGSRFLAGRIRRGEQLGATASLPVKFKALFCRLGQHYVQQLAIANRVDVNPGLNVTFGESWIVKSLSGDYNPSHNHTGELSGIVYTKVPPQVADPANMDGKLQFLFGQMKVEDMDFLGARKVIPVVGDTYIFPAWLTHIVYPFEGEGERISYSFNLLVHNIQAKSE